LVLIMHQAEIERVEKVVAKMLKKNALLAEGDEDALADADETGGKKEPIHSRSERLTLHGWHAD
jgi:hypothetical protein